MDKVSAADVNRHGNTHQQHPARSCGSQDEAVARQIAFPTWARVNSARSALHGAKRIWALQIIPFCNAIQENINMTDFVQ